jgi:hypothetical protein
MAVVRIEALRGLESAIVAVLPALAGKVCVGQAPASHVLEFPSVHIDPRTWRYDPHQAMEVFEFTADSVVMNVGSWSSEIKIRAGASTLFERYELVSLIPGYRPDP